MSKNERHQKSKIETNLPRIKFCILLIVKFRGQFLFRITFWHCTFFGRFKIIKVDHKFPPLRFFDLFGDDDGLRRDFFNRNHFVLKMSKIEKTNFVIFDEIIFLTKINFVI